MEQVCVFISALWLVSRYQDMQVDEKSQMMLAAQLLHGCAGYSDCIWCAGYSLETVVMERYTRLNEQIAMCYASIPLNPNPAELQQMFREIGGPQ